MTDTNQKPQPTQRQEAIQSSGVVRLCEYFPEVGDRFFKAACEIEKDDGSVMTLPDRTIVVNRIEGGYVYHQRNDDPEICDTIEDFSRMAQVSLEYGCNFFPA